jgi:dynamin family protein
MTGKGSGRSWPLSTAVLDLARKAKYSAQYGLAEAGQQAETRLLAPLNVALVGLVSAGKSTLLNALLETPISPTAAGETTRVLYKFSYDRYTMADVHRRDESPPVPLAFEGPRLSAKLPVPPDDVDRVEVTLPADMLKQVTLVDTPGLASTNQQTTAATQRLLEDQSVNAAGAADALIFCINTPLLDEEADAVQLFRSGRAGLRLTGGSAVAVLTKADLLGERPTAWKHAVDLAQKLSTRHADLFAGVAPVIGLLAETARTGALRERHARDLAELAQEWTPEITNRALRHEKIFCGHAGPVTAARRQELVKLLGMFGIGALIEELRAGAPPTAAEMTRIALAVSGFKQMNCQLEVQLGGRSDVLKAGTQLHILMERAHAVGDRDIFSAAQELLDRPEMFELKVFGLARLLASERVKPPPGLAEQAWMLLSTGLPRVTPEEAAGEAAKWRDWAMLTDAEGGSVARVMVRAWQLAAES